MGQYIRGSLCAHKQGGTECFQHILFSEGKRGSWIKLEVPWEQTLSNRMRPFAEESTSLGSWETAKGQNSFLPLAYHETLKKRL